MYWLIGFVAVVTTLLWVGVRRGRKSAVGPRTQQPGVKPKLRPPRDKRTPRSEMRAYQHHDTVSGAMTTTVPRLKPEDPQASAREQPPRSRRFKRRRTGRR